MFHIFTFSKQFQNLFGINLVVMINMTMTTMTLSTLSVMVTVVIKRGILLYRFKLIESLLVRNAKEGFQFCC